jgi:cell division septation protein DedD
MARQYDQEIPDHPRRRGRVTLLLFLLAVALLGLVVLRAYRAQQVESVIAEIPLLRADTSPTRERPEDPGGMDVPHQEVTIFRDLEGSGALPVVERLLPPPEEPIPQPKAEPASDPDPVEDVATSVGQIANDGGDLLRPPAEPAPDAESVADPEAENDPAPPEETPVPLEQTMPETQVSETEMPVPAPPPPPPPPPDEAASPPSPPTVLAARSETPPDPARGYRVQLGAFRSAKDANRGWRDAVAFATELLSPVSHFVMQIDLGEGKGVFHRLQAGPLPSAESAESLCKQLKAKGVDCFVVRP